MKTTTLLAAWFVAMNAFLAIAAAGDGPPSGPAPSESIPPEFPDESPAIHCYAMKKGDQGAISSLLYSDDGTTLIAGNEDGIVHWFDAATGKRTAARRVIPRGVAGADELALSPDGKVLATLTDFNEVSLLDSASGDVKMTLEKLPGARNYLQVAAFSPDGKLFAGAMTSRDVAVWDVATGRKVSTLPPYVIPAHTIGLPHFRKEQQQYPASVSSLDFTADGKTLVVESNVVRAFDVASGRETWRLEGSELLEDLGHSRLSPDDTTLAVARTFNKIQQYDPDAGRGRTALYDRKTGKEIAVLPTRGSTNGFRFTADGKRLVTLEGGRTVRLFDVSTARELSAVRFHERNHLGPMALSSDGKRVAVAGYSSNPMFGIIYQLKVEGDDLKLWKPSTP